VFEVPRPKSSPDHPTSKPVALVAAMIKNSSRSGEIVLDPFLGSGSTLIAAEQLGRRCYGLELDPRYCDVAVRRWEQVSGKKAERA
jgi:DNA modification methylase